MSRRFLQLLSLLSLPALLPGLAAHGNDWVLKLSDRESTVRPPLTSTELAVGAAPDPADAPGEVRHLSEHSEAIEHSETTEHLGGTEHSEESIEYPRQVCRHPGFPPKPLWDRPGDINLGKCPPIRYCQDDCFRAGWPHAIRHWAGCSFNSHYSAWYVGGGAPSFLPHQRERTCEEGTWGLDYSLFHRPRHVWMKWTCGREQGGLGAYEAE